MRDTLTRHACLDCQVQVFPASATTESQRYMVWPQVWKAAGGGRDFYTDWLCVPCLEARLGRSLVVADLMPCPVNLPEVTPLNRDTARLARIKQAMAEAVWPQ